MPDAESWEPMESIDVSEMHFDSKDEATAMAEGLSAQVKAWAGDSLGYTAFWDCRGYWTLAKVHTIPDEKDLTDGND